MQVEIMVKVDGQLVTQRVEQVAGTLEQMEEKIDALSREVACAALQGSVDQAAAPRPLFRQRAANGGTKDTKAAPCKD
jgi:hypothetical protein